MNNDDETIRLLNVVGNILAADTEYPLDGTLLHAELQEGAVGPSIFKDLGDHILYRPASFDLMDPLLDLWGLADPDKRWAEIEYVVRDGAFEVRLTYPEDIDPDEDSLDRRTRVVKRHFGDKPIVYPPFPDDEHLFEL
jgi:hypothetical protein